MSVAVDYQLDQQRCDQQDYIAIELYIQGLTDGYIRGSKQNLEYPYLKGYRDGTKRRKSLLRGSTNFTLKPNEPIPF